MVVFQFNITSVNAYLNNNNLKSFIPNLQTI